MGDINASIFIHFNWLNLHPRHLCTCWICTVGRFRNKANLRREKEAGDKV